MDNSESQARVWHHLNFFRPSNRLALGQLLADDRTSAVTIAGIQSYVSEWKDKCSADDQFSLQRIGAWLGKQAPEIVASFVGWTAQQTGQASAAFRTGLLQPEPARPASATKPAELVQ